MKKIISSVIIILVLIFTAILYFKERVPDTLKKTKNEIRLETELMELSKKYTLQKKEKDIIYQKFLEEKKKKPVIKWKKKIIVKEIDLELWVKKTLYDDLKRNYISLSNYTDQLEITFKNYREVDSISVEQHKKIVQNLIDQRDYQERLKIKYFKKSKRRISFGFHSGLNFKGHANISCGINFRLI